MDFGCGIGNTTRALARAFSKSRVLGVDSSPTSIRHAELLTSSTNTAFLLAGHDRIPAADASCDAVFTACVFHHIEPVERAHWAKEIRRVLAPAGRLFFFEHNPFNPLTRRVVRRVPFDEGVQLVYPRDAAALLHGVGFHVSPPAFYFFFPRILRVMRGVERWLRRVPLGGQYFLVATNPPG
jgi:SAM-dependent methyltransferase